MARCLWAFRRSGDVEDEAWREIAEDLLAGWRHRNRHNDLPRDRGLALDPSRLTVLGTMEIACSLGDEKAIDWQLENFTETYGAFPGLFVSLVRTGHFERGEKLLRRKGR